MDEPAKSLINVELTKPLTRLIETVSAGIGTVYEPTKIVRKAQAEAKAELIRYEAELAKSELAERAKQRLMRNEMRRQVNIENIIQQSTEHLPPEVPEDKVKEDWAGSFFEACKDVSDEMIQSVWAKILAGEIASPGQYKMKTLQVLRSIDKEDAILFMKLSSSCIVIENDWIVPMVFEIPVLHPNITLNYIELVHLQSIGLITIADTDYAFTVRSNEKFNVRYKHEYLAHIHDKKTKFSVGRALLTPAGVQIYQTLIVEKYPSYFDLIITEWAKRGIALSSQYSNPKR